MCGRFALYTATIALAEEILIKVDYKVVLTHHNLTKTNGSAGRGQVQETEKTYLGEIIAKVNDFFEGDLSDHDQLIYVNNVIR